jgi:hypothetical protein
MFVPAEKLEVAKVATPDELRVAVPNSVLPRKKLTVPAGVPVGAGVTVAVSVRLCPMMAGLGAAVRAVAVGTVAVTSNAEEVEVVKAVLPEYSAVTMFVPGKRLDVVKAATPDELTFAVPSSVLPRKKLTVPSGVPGVGVIVAVRVTGCPEATGFGEACSAVAVTVCGLTVSLWAVEVEPAEPALPE